MSQTSINLWGHSEHVHQQRLICKHWWNVPKHQMESFICYALVGYLSSWTYPYCKFSNVNFLLAFIKIQYTTVYFKLNERSGHNLDFEKVHHPINQTLGPSNKVLLGWKALLIQKLRCRNPLKKLEAENRFKTKIEPKSSKIHGSCSTSQNLLLKLYFLQQCQTGTLNI